MEQNSQARVTLLPSLVLGKGCGEGGRVWDTKKRSPTSPPTKKNSVVEDCGPVGSGPGVGVVGNGREKISNRGSRCRR